MRSSLEIFLTAAKRWEQDYKLVKPEKSVPGLLLQSLGSFGLNNSFNLRGTKMGKKEAEKRVHNE